MAVMSEYLWFVIVGAFVAFAFGWGNGANDLANGFATSVGSKTLTMGQAVMIAIVFDFLGAILLGRVVTSTIASGVADINAFIGNPEVYAYGMICACTAGSFWLAVASRIGVNVSGTHFIVGGIVAFSLIWDGKDAVIWAERDNSIDAFPFKGVISIVTSWIMSPILAAAGGALLFWVLRSLVLRRKNAYKVAFWTLPPTILITVFINFYFIFTKGAKKQMDKDGVHWSYSKTAWISACIALGAAVLSALTVVPFLNSKINSTFDEQGNRLHPEDLEAPVKKETFAEASTGGKIWKVVSHGWTQDIHDVIITNKTVAEIHSNAEVFEPRVEYAFMYLQVFSAICVIFSHGAGEVGYAAGPMSIILQVYEDGVLTKNIQPKIWVVVFGGLALISGLATYGYHTMRTMGVKLTKVTPTRGFCAELATAMVVMVASQYGLPQSGSLVIVGAIVGVGMVEGLGGVNWKQFFIQVVGWALSTLVVGLTVSALFAQGLYAPSAIDSKAINEYKSELSAINTQWYKEFNTTLQSYRQASEDGVLDRLPIATWNELNATLHNHAKTAKDLGDFKKYAAKKPEAYIQELNTLFALLQENTILTIGQNDVFDGSVTCNSNVTAAITAGTLVPCMAPKLAGAGTEFIM
ncbi:solute carrier family 20 (sodium-dependent phosphate transporter) [Marchantia polymorpha subsp. ruderalis]